MWEGNDEDIDSKGDKEMGKEKIIKKYMNKVEKNKKWKKLREKNESREIEEEKREEEN